MVGSGHVLIAEHSVIFVHLINADQTGKQPGRTASVQAVQRRGIAGDHAWEMMAIKLGERRQIDDVREIARRVGRVAK